MKNIIEKYFKKTEKNIWIAWNDYILKDDLNPEYSFYLTATIHCPVKSYSNSNRLEDRFYKIFLHRIYNRETFERNIEEGESTLVYKGLIEKKRI